MYKTIGEIKDLIQPVENYYNTDMYKWINNNFQRKGDKEISDEIISVIVMRLDLNNKVFKTNIKEVCNKIAEVLLEEIKDIISSSPGYGFMTAFSLFKCHLLMTYEIFSWYKERKSESYQEESETGFNEQLDSYFSQIKSKSEFDALFYRLQCHIASEKIILKLLLEITHDNSIQPIKSDPELHVVNMLEYSRALGRIIMIGDQVSKAVGCKKELNFDSKGYVYYQQEEKLNFHSVGNQFLSWITKKDFDNFSTEAFEKLKPICNKYVGFSIDELFNLLEILIRKDKSNAITIFSLNNLYDKLQDLTNKERFEIDKLLSFISRKPSINNDYIKSRIRRPLKTSIFYYNDNCMITCTSLLISSLMCLISDILYNKVELEPFNKEIEKIHEEINEEFEIKTFKLLKNNLTQNICHNFTKIGSKPPYIEPKGQIDILAYYNKQLYVIECKNYALKTTVSSVSNELKNIYKEMKILSDKVGFVKEHIKLILPSIGVEQSEFNKLKNISGLVVTQNFSFGEVSDTDFPIVNYYNLIEWLKNNS